MPNLELKTRNVAHSCKPSLYFSSLNIYKNKFDADG